MSQVRLRTDAAYDSNRPTRAEYFMPGEGRTKRGLPLPERRVDYQEVHAYGEVAFSPSVSLFFDTPIRFLDPTINRNHTGFGDLQVGVKYAFFQEGTLTSSLQLRGYIPTGAADKGLGTGHPSIEPGLLVLWEPSNLWRVESEFQLWVPINDQR